MVEKDKSKKVFRIRRIMVRSWPFVLAALVFLSTRLAVRNPGFVEHYYSEGIYPFVAVLLSTFSSLIPFSLWDIFWFGTILLIISGLILIIFRRMKLLWYGLVLARFLSVLYLLFYLLWGYNYFRSSLETRLGWEKSGADETAFRSVFDSIITHTNTSYTSISASDYSLIDNLVEESFRKNSAEFGISYPNGKRRTKTMLFSSFFAKAGLNGYFGPFFNEVHLNRKVLQAEYPFVLAHEKSHQFGIASESEANLIAFVICTGSDDRRLQYSGYLYMLVYFLPDAAHLKDYQDFIKKIDKQVILDLQYRKKYYKGLQKEKLQKVQSAANNAYLKSNNIRQGIKNYNQVVSLVINWYHNSSQ
jgi:hypothetical protein